MSETPTINPDPTPKQKFLQHTKLVRDHNAMIESDTFDVGADIALLEYQRLLVATTTQENLNQCAVGHIKITGAQEFLKVLKKLGLEPTTPPVVRNAGNLQHNQ